MKRTIIKSLIFGLLCALLPSGAASAANSEVGITSANVFEFAPGNAYSASDLFDSYKNVMPGDTLIQTVTLKNSGNRTAEISIRADTKEKSGGGANSKSAEALLDALHLKVETALASGITRTLYDDTLGNSATSAETLMDWVSLGTFAPGKSITFTLTLTVPGELTGSGTNVAAGFTENEFMNQLACIDWQFLCVDYERPASDPAPTALPALRPVKSSPKSGDASDMALLVIIAAALFICCALTAVYMLRKKHNDRA